MQWLIDIVIEYLQANGYLLPAYIWRGDVDNFDWVLVDFTIDNNYHELDLSALVPDGAKAVHFRFQLNCRSVGRFVNFVKADQIYTHVGYSALVKHAFIVEEHEFFVACTTDRKIKYKFKKPATYDLAQLVIKGWLL